MKDIRSGGAHGVFPRIIDRLRPDRFSLLLVALSFLGAAIVLLRVHHGVGINGDAKYYIEVARAFADGERALIGCWGESRSCCGTTTQPGESRPTCSGSISQLSGHRSTRSCWLRWVASPWIRGTWLAR